MHTEESVRQVVEEVVRRVLEVFRTMHISAENLHTVNPPAATGCGKTHRERVIAALEQIGSWATVNEVAAITGIEPSSIRVVFAADGNETFERHAPSRRRVFWKVRVQSHRHVQEENQCQLAGAV